MKSRGNTQNGSFFLLKGLESLQKSLLEILKYGDKVRKRNIARCVFGFGKEEIEEKKNKKT